jgi:hypothetical protein
MLFARQPTFQGVASEEMLRQFKEQGKKPAAAAAAAAMKSNQVPTNLEALVFERDRLALEIAIRNMQHDRLQRGRDRSNRVPTKLKCVAQNDRIAREIALRIDVDKTMARMQQHLVVNNPYIVAAQKEEMARKRMQHDKLGQDTTLEQALTMIQQLKMPYTITLNRASTVKLVNNPFILRRIHKIQLIQKRMLALRERVLQHLPETDLTRRVLPPRRK